MCLPSDALLQHLPSYLGFSYLGHGVSLHSCSSKMQPLLLTLEEGYLLTAAQPSCARTATTPWMWGCSSQPLSCVRLFVTPWTVAYQVPPSMGFSSQEYWSGLPFPSPFYIVKIVNNYSKMLPIICIIAYYPLSVTMF